MRTGTADWQPVSSGQPEGATIRVHVVVAEPDPLICEGLAESLAEEPRLAAYPSPEPPEAALDRCRELRPSVLLLSEFYLPAMNLAAFGEQIDWGRGVPVVVLGSAPDPEKLMRCLRLGCMGYVHRRESLATLRRAVCAAAAGQIWAPRAAVTTLLRQLVDSQRHAPLLSRREQEIFSLIGDGLSNAEISRRLYISPETVRWHVRRLFAKVGTRNRTQAADLASRTLFALRRQPPARPAPIAVRSSGWSGQAAAEAASGP
jgi:DNA-binding NarL/FixJ family response regulator